MQAKVEIQLLIMGKIDGYTVSAKVGGADAPVVVDTEKYAAYNWTPVKVAVAADKMRETYTISVNDANGTPVTPESGLSDIKNSYADKEVSHLGSTVSIKFDASASWTAELALKTTPDVEWAAISQSTQSGDARKAATVRVVIEANKTPEARELELWVTVEGFEKELVATLVQAASGSSADSKINAALNTYMHDILKEDYLKGGGFVMFHRIS